MRKYILIGIAIFILLLDWLALDDITTGKEPSLVGEYLIIIINLPILAAIGFVIKITDLKKNLVYASHV